MNADTPPIEPTHRLSEEVANFVSSGISITASSRDGRYIPSICRVLACTTNEERTQVRLLLVKSQALQLLRDIAATQEIAVVFSKPSTHKTMQIKGADACQTDLIHADITLIERSTRAFADELLTLGYGREFSRAFHHYSPEELVALRFSPLALYEQSPGPDAGKTLELAE